MICTHKNCRYDEERIAIFHTVGMDFMCGALTFRLLFSVLFLAAVTVLRAQNKNKTERNDVSRHRRLAEAAVLI